MELKHTSERSTVVIGTVSEWWRVGRAITALKLKVETDERLGSPPNRVYSSDYLDELDAKVRPTRLGDASAERHLALDRDEVRGVHDGLCELASDLGRVTNAVGHLVRLPEAVHQEMAMVGLAKAEWAGAVRPLYQS